MYGLFRNLIWPAVAGNVAWSFFSVAVGESWTAPVCFRMLALGLVAGYLMLSWTMERDAPQSTEYYLLDSIFAVAIVIFAISTEDLKAVSSGWVTSALGAIFVAALFGHICKVWEPNRAAPQRYMLAGANAVGIVILLAGHFCFSHTDLWHRPVAIGAVVVLWFWILSKYPRYKGG